MTRPEGVRIVHPNGAVTLRELALHISPPSTAKTSKCGRWQHHSAPATTSTRKTSGTGITGRTEGGTS
jgi:hypothetical protein